MCVCVFVCLCLCVFVTAGWVSSICCVCVADTAIRLEEQHRREPAVVNTNSIAARQRISIQCTWTAGAEYTSIYMLQCNASADCVVALQLYFVKVSRKVFLTCKALSGLVFCEASRKAMLTCKAPSISQTRRKGSVTLTFLRKHYCMHIAQPLHSTMFNLPK